MKKITIALTTIFLIGGFVFTTACAKKESAELPKGDLAYNFALEDLNGKTVHLSDFKGKVVILDFWDTWCPPCKAEIPHFIELYDQYKDNGLVIIGAAGARYGKDAVKKFATEYNMNYVNLIANEDAIRGYGGVTSIPTTFVIDKNGNIYKKYIGYKSKDVFESDINSLLNS
jgi:cytochrome c biogenesis protein CcmG/thiol:disulfide interchange protein DsbE